MFKINLWINKFSDTFIAMNSQMRATVLALKQNKIISDRVEVAPVDGENMLVTSIRKYAELRKAETPGVSLTMSIADRTASADTIAGDVRKVNSLLKHFGITEEAFEQTSNAFIFQMRAVRPSVTIDLDALVAQYATSTTSAS